MRVGGKYDCSGCTACMEVCPVNAIEMKPDRFGFLYPVINEGICIRCKLCENVCPFHPEYDKPNDNLPLPLSYGIRNKNIEEVKTSRSGAMFMAIAKWVIEQGGVVYGAGYDNRFNVKHVRVNNLLDLNILKGSKYVQSDLRGVLSSVERDLKKNIVVAFSGTPCQTAGLFSYLLLKKISTDKLFLIDLVCHGVPSPYVWRDYFHYIENKMKDKIVGVNFRDKSIFGWAWHEESFVFQHKHKIYLNAYTTLFYTHLNMRYSCFRCKYTNLMRPSDITLADFWEWKKCLPESFNNDNLGVSQVLINSLKGLALFENIKDELVYCKVELEKSIQYAMKNATPEPAERDFAEKYYDENGFIPFMCKYSNIGPLKNLRAKFRRLKSLVKK